MTGLSDRSTKFTRQKSINEKVKVFNLVNEIQENSISFEKNTQSSTLRQKHYKKLVCSIRFENLYPAET